MLNDGDCIEFLADVRAPVAQAGSKGERRIVGKTIGNYPANYLLRGGYIKKIEEQPAETITAPAPKPQTAPVRAKEAPAPKAQAAPERAKEAPAPKAQAAPEREKQERSNEYGKDDGRADQEGDHREQDQPEAEAD